MRSTLQWIQRALFIGAVLTLGYTSFAIIDAWVFQLRASRQLDLMTRTRQNVQGSPQGLMASLAAEGLIGRMEIPRLGLSVLVAEGADRFTLRRAAGHIPGTALPGQPGNVGISAHRDTFFRPLRNIQRNDVITITTALGEYRYRVLSARIVSPRDTGVLLPSGKEMLTLVTCYPFYFIGPAPARFIVRAQRIV